MRRALALMPFMVANGLIRFDPFYLNGELGATGPSSARISRKKGRLFMEEEWPKWRARVDRGSDPFRSGMPDRHLNALRERHGAY